MENNFTPSQKAAIAAPGSAAVVAGAGSGKTLVLIERFRHLLANDVPLNRILAFTFTEKAAGEINQRLLKAGIIRDDEEVQAGVGTIHSFFTSLLRRHGPLLGLDPDFKILGDASQVLDLETRLRSFLLSKIKENNSVL
ncbi:MAG: UvrD-helicase domain-containing protein, partial [Deltaproteobacteria bacterium]|nr:UvrD-helicase domain-containing protein [Deltaproteobacteria bacterium]